MQYFKKCSFLRMSYMGHRRTHSRTHFLNELIKTHVKLDNIFFWKRHLFEIDIFYLSWFNSTFRKELARARSLVVSDFHSETKYHRFESGF